MQLVVSFTALCSNFTRLVLLSHQASRFIQTSSADKQQAGASGCSFRGNIWAEQTHYQYTYTLKQTNTRKLRSALQESHTKKPSWQHVGLVNSCCTASLTCSEKSEIDREGERDREPLATCVHHKNHS